MKRVHHRDTEDTEQRKTEKKSFDRIYRMNKMFEILFDPVRPVKTLLCLPLLCVLSPRCAGTLSVVNSSCLLLCLCGSTGVLN
jgi:hypothetical protein